MEKYRASVRTILSRIESHPDEFREHFGKWEDIQNAVADRVGGERNRLRGLTDEEVEAIFNKLKEHIWGPQFDAHVMEKVLDPQREERGLDAYNISLGKRQKAELQKLYEEQRRQQAEHIKLHKSFAERILNKLKP
jgi:hypothetical protein